MGKKRLFWGCHSVGFECGSNPKFTACAVAVEIQFFFVRWGVLIFLLHWLVYLPVKLMCLDVELLLCMYPPVKMVYFFFFSVRYFLLGRCLLRLHTTCRAWRSGGFRTCQDCSVWSTSLSIYHKSLIGVLSFKFARQPPLRQSCVSGSVFLSIFLVNHFQCWV